jgi:ATP-binding cassette subfamily B (MDR/TAP) protein 1
MSLVFGNLAQDFVAFTFVIVESQAGNSTATNVLPEAAAKFRHAAARDSLDMFCIGKTFPVSLLNRGLT